MAMILQERTLTALRLLAVCHLAGLATQPVFAGRYLGGDADALGIHATIGETIAWLAIAQALVALICWFQKRLPLWAAGAFVLIFALDGLQIHMGYAKAVAVHIPLGASLLTISFAMTLWLWRYRAIALSRA
jgi:hypothetical protein